MRKAFLLILSVFYLTSLLSQSQWTELRVGPSAALAASSASTICLDRSGNVYVPTAKWNGNYWASYGACGDGFNGGVSCLLMGRYGELYAGGDFSWGSPPVIGIGALFADTAYWSDIGAPPCSAITTMCLDTANILYAVGVFSNSSGNYYVASEALGWGELGGNNALAANNYIYALYSGPSAHIYAAGDFTDTGGQRYVAKYDSARWSELGTGANRLNPNGSIFAITGDSVGNIYAAGAFTDSNSKTYVAKWNGTTWSELGTGPAALNVLGNINALTFDRAGNLYAVGGFVDTPGGKSFVAKWDGLSWSKVGQGSNSLNVSGAITAICIDSAGHIFIDGDFDYVLEWNGNSWNPLGLVNFNNPYQPISGAITLLMCNTDSVVYGGPSVDSAGNNCIVKWIGTNCYEVGTGANGLNTKGDILSICHDPSGNIYVSGALPDTSGSSAVFKWNGNNWSSIGSFGGSLAIQYNPYAVNTGDLCADSHGNLYAINYCGSPQPYGAGTLVMWNGSRWTDITPYDLIFGYYHLCADKHGNIYLSGDNTTLSRIDIEKWNGIAWSEILTFPNGTNITSMGMDTLDNIYISGNLSDSVGHVCDMAVHKADGSMVYDSTGFNVSYMTITPQQRICAITDSGYCEWNGTRWHSTAVNGYCFTGSDPTVICGDYTGNIYLSGVPDLGTQSGFIDTRTGYGYVAKYYDTSGVYIDTVPTFIDTATAPTAISAIGIKGFDIYPNPTNGTLIIQFEGPVSGVVSISDIEGQQLMALPLNKQSKKQIDISDFANGVYIVNVESSYGMKQNKIITKE